MSDIKTTKTLRILVVDDDPIARAYLSNVLKEDGYRHVHSVCSAEEACDYLGLDDSAHARANVDIILMDIELPGMNGFELTRLIKADGVYTDVPVAFTSAYTCDSSLENAFESGGIDFIGKPFNRVELIARVRTLVEQRNNALELRRMAYFDPLTGLPNRTLLRDRFEQMVRRAERYQRSFAMLFLDLNQFKKLNDRYGHEIGDEALVGIARRIQNRVRRSDTFARLGGDEFVILLDDVLALEDATTLATDVIQTVRLPFEIEGEEWRIGVSIGIALFPQDGSEYNDLLSTADKMMYLAKQRLEDGYCYTNGECSNSAS